MNQTILLGTTWVPIGIRCVASVCPIVAIADSQNCRHSLTDGSQMLMVSEGTYLYPQTRKLLSYLSRVPLFQAGYLVPVVEDLRLRRTS